jgi:diguanylate cyclase (GGDEF)-like protein/PAS domain S-box-containing protein
VDPDGRIVYANQEAARLTGYRRSRLERRGVDDLVPEDRRASHARWRAGWNPERRPMGSGLRINCRRAEGSTFPADVSLAPMTFGGVEFVVAGLRDETEHRRSEDELLRRALHDPLTWLPNRVLFLDRLTQAMARTGRDEGHIAVLYIDLDGFKAINDNWGHAAGDAVLRAVGRRLAGAVRPGDTVARFGGDEFLVLCERLASDPEAADVAQRLLEAIGLAPGPAIGAGGMSASVGIAVPRNASDTAAGLVDAADRAMYRAKRSGSHAAWADGNKHRAASGRRP